MGASSSSAAVEPTEESSGFHVLEIHTHTVGVGILTVLAVLAVAWCAFRYITWSHRQRRGPAQQPPVPTMVYQPMPIDHALAAAANHWNNVLPIAHAATSSRPPRAGLPTVTNRIVDISDLAEDPESGTSNGARTKTNPRASSKV